MSTTRLSTHAKERSTYVVSVSFSDESGNDVTPTSVQWTLSDSSGVVINSRQRETITPASTVDIVLTGSDLQILSNEQIAGRRLLTVEARYNSTYGNSLYMKEDVAFHVDNLKAVTTN